MTDPSHRGAAAAPFGDPLPGAGACGTSLAIG
jgi:hypothetical protein